MNTCQHHLSLLIVGVMQEPSPFVQLWNLWKLQLQLQCLLSIPYHPSDAVLTAQ